MAASGNNTLGSPPLPKSTTASVKGLLTKSKCEISAHFSQEPRHTSGEQSSQGSGVYFQSKTQCQLRLLDLSILVHITMTEQNLPELIQIHATDAGLRMRGHSHLEGQWQCQTSDLPSPSPLDFENLAVGQMMGHEEPGTAVASLSPPGSLMSVGTGLIS